MARLRDGLLASLSGLLCVYKPADLSVDAIKKTIIKQLCAQGNAALGWPKLPDIKLPIVEEHPESGALVVIGHKKQLDYSRHPLVVGEEWRAEDVRIEELKPLQTSSSGVCVFGLNDGVELLPALREQQWACEWRLEAILGRETEKHQIKGKVIRRESYEHVTRQKLSSLLTRMQSDYRRVAFEMAEVDLQSSEAFKLAIKGVPRPKLIGAQLVTEVQLQLFKLPYFALKVTCIGETDAYLRCLVAEIGNSLLTASSPVRLIRRSVGPFRPEHALLERQLSLQNMIDNVSMLRKVLKEYEHDDEVVSKSTKDVSEDAIQKRKLILAQMVTNELSPEEFDAMRPAWPRSYT